MGDMWHNVSRISKTINSAKRIRLGEKSDFPPWERKGGEKERNQKLSF